MKKKTIIIGAVLVTLLGTMVVTLASNKMEIDSRKEVRVTNNKVAVTVISAEMKETANSLEFVGTADANKEVNVATETSGKVVQIHFKMGDYVQKGKVLAKIEDTYKRLAYENAKINYDKCKEDYNRYQALRKGDAVSDTQLRDSKIGYENADIQLKNAKKQWDDTKIVAPFSGYITSQNTELGAYVNIGAVVAGMADISQLKVTLEVAESDAYELHKGQEVSISTEIHPDYAYKGVLSAIGQKSSSAHNYPVEISIANTGKNQLKAGTYVKVKVDMGKTARALMIPRDAIVSSVKDPSVYVIKGDIAKLVKISTGRDYKSNLEVIAGLREGDKVVTNGQINLMDNAKVTIIN